MPESERWYRVEDGRYAPPLNDWGDPVGHGRPYLSILDFPVLAHTPKGVWLEAYGARRFVLLESHKRFACPTIDEAVESWRARKRRQATILRAQLAHVAEVMGDALNLLRPEMERLARETAP